MDTGRSTVDSQEDMTTWRQVRVCFLCLLGLIQLCLDTTLLNYCRGKLFGRDACFTSTVLDEKLRCLSDGAMIRLL